MGVIKEYIIKIDEDQNKKDINGGYPLIEHPLELVRCKDCKYMYRLPWLDDETFKAMVCRKHNYTGMREEDFFCADGEKEQSGNDA